MLTHLASCLIAWPLFGDQASELGWSSLSTPLRQLMGRYNKTEPLRYLVGVRLSENAYNKLEAQRKVTNCQTLSEFARMILQREEIIWYHKDIGQESIAVELTAIRKELKAIGTNINQMTRYFHGSNVPSQKIFEALKILDEYKKVQGIIDPLFAITDRLINTWSPK